MAKSGTFSAEAVFKYKRALITSIINMYSVPSNLK